MSKLTVPQNEPGAEPQAGGRRDEAAHSTGAKTPDSKEGREKWVHEDLLINHRLTWLGVTQGLLFAALGVAVHEAGSSNTQPLPKLLIGGIPLIGLISSLLIFVGVLGAIVAMVKIRRVFFPDKELGVSNVTTMLGWTCALGLPTAFVFSWIWVVITVRG